MHTANILFPIFSLTLLLASCKNELAHGKRELETLPEINTQLPVASSAKKPPCSATNRVFLTLGNGEYRLKGYAKALDLQSLEKALQHEHQQTEAGQLPLLYLVSPPDLFFAEITTAIRAAAKAGFADIFIVAKRDGTSGNYLKHGILLQLPVADGTPPPVIAPVFIKANSKGQVFINTGPSQELLDEGIDLRHLPKLKEHLDVYCAAARAGGHPPHAQIYVEPNAPHQRAIDILNTLHALNFRNITFTTITSDPNRTCEGMGKGQPGTATKSPSAIPRPPPMKNPIK